jgi:hypothetical protein
MRRGEDEAHARREGALHALPAGGHLRRQLRGGRGFAERLRAYRIATYREASYKPFVIAAMILMARFKNYTARSGGWPKD